LISWKKNRPTIPITTSDHATLDLFEEVGAEADLLALLRQALGTREGIEIVWSRA